MGADVRDQDWRLRSLRPSDALVLGVGAARSACNGLAELAFAAAVVGIAVGFFLLPNLTVARVLATVSALAGAHLAWKLHKTNTKAGGWCTPGLAVLLTALALCSTGPLLLLGSRGLQFTGFPDPITLASLLSLGWWELFARLPDRGKVKVSEPWWAHYRIATALVTAGVLKMVKVPGGEDQLPTINYVGRARHDDAGEWRHFRLPPGATWIDVRDRHAALASAFGVPEDLLHVEHDPEQPANVVTIVMLHKRDLSEPVPAEIPTGPTDFTQPILLGHSHLGRAVQFLTLGTHSLLVAKTRAGKTWLMRFIAMFAFLDPRCAVLIFSYKDDEEDWQPARDLVAATPEGVDGYIGPIEDEAGIDRSIALLRFIKRVGDYRSNVPKSERFPLFVVVDEWMLGVETAKGIAPKKAAEMERLALMLGASAASRNIHLCYTFQRGTTDFLDSGLKANLGQRLLGLVKSQHDIRAVFDVIPQVLPRKAGEFIVSLADSTPELIRTPKLDDRTWADVVIPLARRLRSDQVPAALLPELAEHERLPVTELYPEAEPVDSELAVHVFDVLHKAARPLQATAIYDALGEVPYRPSTSAWLGRELAQMPGVQRVTVGTTRCWELAPGARSGPQGLLARPHRDYAQEHAVPAEEATVGAVLAPTGTEGLSLHGASASRRLP